MWAVYAGVICGMVIWCWDAGAVSGVGMWEEYVGMCIRERYVWEVCQVCMTGMYLGTIWEASM